MSILDTIIKEYGTISEIDRFEYKELDKFCNNIYQKYCSIFVHLSYVGKVKWILRTYFAAKKILLSAIFFTQAQYIDDKNLFNLKHYTMYYSLFNALSANIILAPYFELKLVMNISHKRIFMDIENFFIRKNIFPSSMLTVFNELRFMRELYSYHLPIGGNITAEYPSLDSDVQLSNLEQILPLSLSLSNLLSFLMYYAWNRKKRCFKDEYAAYSDEVNEVFFSFISYNDFRGKYNIIGDDDYYRLGYILRKFQGPIPISWFLVEKICEDFECSVYDTSNSDNYDFSDATQYISTILNA